MKGSITEWFEKYVDDIESPQLRHLIWLINLELESRERQPRCLFCGQSERQSRLVGCLECRP